MTDATACEKALDANPRGPAPDVAMNSKAPEPGTVALVLRSPDVILLAVALLPALGYGAPELGFLLGAGGWILQRMLAVVDRRWIGNVADPVRQLAVNLFESFGRIWLLAGVIILAAVLGEREDGLTAAVVIFVAYSVAFVARLYSRARRPKAAE